MDETSSKDLAISNDQQTLKRGDTARETQFESATAGAKTLHAVALTVRGVLQISLMAVVLVVSTFLMFQLAESRKETPKRARKEAVYTISALRAEPASNRPMITVYGEVMAGRSLNLTPLVPGEVIWVNPKLQIGGRLDKGDVVIRIDPFAYEVARDEAIANLNEAKAALSEAEVRLSQEETGLKRTGEQFALAEADLARASALFESGTLTRRTVEERELIVSQRKAAMQTSGANIKVQKAQIDARKAAIARFEVQVKNTRADLQKTQLKAPFDAIVQSVNVELGQTVATSLSLVSLYEANTLDARFVLSDRQFGRIASHGDVLKRPVRIDWRTGELVRTYKGSIDRIGAEVSANRGGVTLFARVQAGGREDQLRPGAFVTVNVEDRLYDNTYRMPETALYDGEVVYVVGEDSRLHVRKVNVVVFDGDHVIIDKGLEPGDMVLTTQIAEVGEGILVRLAERQDSAVTTGDGSAGVPDPDKHRG